MKHIIRLDEKARHLLAHYLPLMGIVLGVVFTGVWIVLLGRWLLGLVGY